MKLHRKTEINLPHHLAYLEKMRKSIDQNIDLKKYFI